MVQALYQIRGACLPTADAEDFCIIGVVTNLSSHDWNERHKVGVRYSGITKNQKLQLPVEFRAVLLSEPLTSGASAIFTLRFQKYLIPQGHRYLYLDVVNEGEYWLSDNCNDVVVIDIIDATFPKTSRFRPNDAGALLDCAKSLAIQGQAEDAFGLLMQSHHIDGNAEALITARQLLASRQEQAGHASGRAGISEVMLKIMSSGFFDPVWYLKRYPDLDPKHVAPLRHFADHGGYEGRSPGPHFDTEWYLSQNPDLAPGVKSRQLHPLLHYIEHGASEGRSPAPPTPTMLGTIETLLADVMDLDPLLYAREQFQHVKGLRCIDNIPQSRAFDTFRNAYAALERPYDYIITVPWMVHGGADLMAINMAKAVTSQRGPHSVLILAVDYTRADARDWIPTDIDFIALQSGQEFSTPETMEVLLYFIQAMQPKCIINVNSMATWELFRIYGKSLGHSMQLYGCAFCRDYNQYDQPAGFADTHVREALTNLTGLISDNASFFQTLVDQFGIPQVLRSRFIPLYNPITPFHLPRGGDETARRTETAEAQPLRVLWASRYVRQKNIALLRRIIEAAPDISFDVWGQGDAEEQLRDLARTRPNLHVMGAYPSFAALPLHSYGAFLYTSLWDGIPNVLLEAAAADLPIIASDVGGIHELVTPTTGWIVNDLMDPAPYVAALRSIRDNPGDALQRRRAMQALITTQHSWSRFTHDLAQAVLGQEMTHER